MASLRPGGGVRKLDWECPAGFELETIVCDRKGGLFLVSAHRVIHRSAAGALADVAEAGSASGAAALGADGSLWLGSGDRLLRVDRDRSVRTVAPGLGEVFGVAVDPAGTAFVTDWRGGRVLRISGGTVSVVAAGLSYPSGIVIDGNGRLFVKESGRQSGTRGRILSVSPEGRASVFAELRRD